MRISGIMSGMDTEGLIQKMMKAENMRVDKVRRDREYTVWRQEGFREIIEKFRTFQSNYFDVLKPKQNIGSATSFGSFTHKVTSLGQASTAVTVAANASIKDKHQVIDSITQLATADVWEGGASGLRGIVSDDVDIDSMKALLSNTGKDFEITVAIGGVGKKIALDASELAGISDVDGLKDALNTKITEAFGADYTGVVSAQGNALRFDFAGNEVKIITFGANKESSGALGLERGASSYGYRNKTIGELFGLTDGALKGIKINGKEIELSASYSVAKMMDVINKSGAGVNLSFNSLNDKFTLKAAQTGTANNITFEDGSPAELLFSKLFGSADVITATGVASGIVRNEAQNAKLSLNGVDIVQGQNTFTHEGLTVTLNAVSNDPIHIDVETDSEKIVEHVKAFLKDYNELLDMVNDKITEKRNSSYQPLTEAERDELSETQLEKWDEKAKSGILRGNGTLQNMLTELRNAVVEPMEGVGITLKSMGIESAGWKDRGKLTMDETKFKAALENRYDEVVGYFTRSSEIQYMDATPEDRKQRYKENGLAARFDDILKDYTRTTRDKDGNKGLLLMKAGMEKDTSALTSELSKKVREYDSRIADLVKSMVKKENYYYAMFARMETALSKMESQSASLMGMMGMGGK